MKEWYMQNKTELDKVRYEVNNDQETINESWLMEVDCKFKSRAKDLILKRD